MIKFISILSLSLFFGRTHDYITYQGLLRFFPCAIMFLYVGILYNKPLRKMFILLGYLIGLFGIIWNKEYGIVMTLSWAVYVIFNKFQTNPSESLKNKIIIIVKNMVYFVFSFIGAWITAGLINCCCYSGDFISLETFLIPYLNKNYMVNSLQSFPLSKNEYQWIWVMSTALLALGLFGLPAIFGTEKMDKTDKSKGAIVFAAVAVLVGMLYYINRSFIGNLYVVYFQGIALLSLCVERIYILYQKYINSDYKLSLNLKHNTKIDFKKNIISQCITGIYIGINILMCGIAVCALIDVGYYQYKRNYDETNEYEKLVVSVKENVPENTPAIGCGVMLLYWRLGWDTQYHLTDAMYQTEEATARFEEILKDGNDKFISMFSIDEYVDAKLIDEDIYDYLKENYDMIYVGQCSGTDFYYLKHVDAEKEQ